MGSRSHRSLARRSVVLLLSLIIFTAVLFRKGFVSIQQINVQQSFSYQQQDQQGRNVSIENTSTKIISVGFKDYEESSTPSTNTTVKTKQGTRPASPSHRKKRVLKKEATILIQLSGEMSNNLHHIAHGIGLQYWAKEEHGIEMNIVLRHDTGANARAPYPKWKKARDAIKKCFPVLATWDFTLGNSPDYKRATAKQLEWLGKGRYDRLTGMINSGDVEEIEKGLNYLASEILTDPNRPIPPKGSSIRFPYLFSQTLDVFPMIDKYYSRIRQTFQFNDSACCNQIPEPDESVFHYRNFGSEMPSRRAYEMGFAEISPKLTAEVLFGDLSDGTKVGVVSRIPNQLARDQVEALLASGKQARFVEEQLDVEDFCFLKNTKNLLAGSARSTFAQWAGLLGTAKKVRLYHLENHGLISRHPNFWERFTYNWTNPDLKNRVEFTLYKAEEGK